ncbi:hypothetical protein GCM10025865_12400 [Paraoerskovia sediminicola]|uniref:Uncharacterized protein n=1 Tax=Paraoerskovia sediminicola TaxID=1138587 RepID=A0ABM8G1H4_9CELL|nr:hypothetical protein GCM10025865_12400 [Paraoerskovia sediminicola]
MSQKAKEPPPEPPEPLEPDEPPEHAARNAAPATPNDPPKKPRREIPAGTTNLDITVPFEATLHPARRRNTIDGEPVFHTLERLRTIGNP